MKISEWEPVLALLVSPKRDHVRGPLAAPVSLVEYGDYECPYCGGAQPIIDEIQQQMGEALQFVFRNFPLAMIYPHAEMAAEAAEAAGVQGKFWDMHHLLYSRQDRLDFVVLTEYAEAVGLDTVRFRDDLEAHAFAGKVAEDFMSGVRSGVNGTPSLLHQRTAPPWDFNNLLGALQNAAAARKAA